MIYDIDRSLPCSARIFMEGRLGKRVEWIVVHYTADAGSAWANAEYCRRGLDGDPNIRSAHYFIDSSSIFQSVREEDTAWHGGNDDMSERSIGIEVCSLGEDFTVGEVARLADLVQDIMSRHGIDAGHVIRHYDVADHAYGYVKNPHKMCPAPYTPNGADPDGAKWRKLHAAITGGITREELPVEFLGRVDEKEPLCYFCGMSYKTVGKPSQSEAIQSLYKQIHGTSIPMVQSDRVKLLKDVIDGK